MTGRRVNSEQLIAWPKLVMIQTGFFTLPVSDNRLVQLLFNGYSLFQIGGYVLFWLSIISECLRLALGKYPSLIVFGSLSVVVNATKILAKVFIFKKNGVLDMFGEIITNETDIWMSYNEIKEVYRRKIRICKIYTTSIVMATIMAVGGLIFTGARAAVVLKHYNMANNQSVESHDMYMLYLPWNKLDHLGWTFVAEGLSGWIAGSFNSVTHVIYASLLVYCASRLEVLQVKFRNFVREDESKRNKYLALRYLVIEHQDIINYVDYLNQSTKSIVLLEFMLSSLDMASVSTNLIKNELDKRWLLAFMLLLMVQICIFGWCCNEVKVQSEALGDALYASEWYSLDQKTKQLLQVMMMRAQKPLMMTIGPFGPMTTNSILLVLKASYSYVSIMKQ